MRVHSTAWYSLVLHNIVLYKMVLLQYNAAFYHMVLHGLVWYYIMLYCIVWYCIGYGMVFHDLAYGIAWYCIILYDIALDRMYNIALDIAFIYLSVKWPVFCKTPVYYIADFDLFDIFALGASSQSVYLVCLIHSLNIAVS